MRALASAAPNRALQTRHYYELGCLGGMETTRPRGSRRRGKSGIGVHATSRLLRLPRHEAVEDDRYGCTRCSGTFCGSSRDKKENGFCTSLSCAIVEVPMWQ